MSIEAKQGLGFGPIHNFCLDESSYFLELSLMQFPAFCLWTAALISASKAETTPQGLGSIIHNISRITLIMLVIATPMIIYINLHEPCSKSEHIFWIMLTCSVIVVFISIFLYVRILRKSILASLLNFITDFLLVLFLQIFAVLIVINSNLAFIHPEGSKIYFISLIIALLPLLLAVILSKTRDNYKISVKSLFAVCTLSYVLDVGAKIMIHLGALS